jgi:opacity protein-like surface antigen
MYQRLVLFFTLLALSATSLFSQSDVRPRYFIGYSNLQAEGLPNKNDPDNIISPDFLDRRSTLHGVNAEATLPIQNFGITGDFSFNRNKQSSDFSNASQSMKTDVFYFVAGPSFQFRNQSRFEPFVRLMGGAARTNFEVSTRRSLAAGTVSNDFDTGSTDLALMVGGGVDMRVNDRVTLRVLQVDWAPIFLGDRAVRILGQAGALQTTELEGQRQDHVRFSFGVTF